MNTTLMINVYCAVSIGHTVGVIVKKLKKKRFHKMGIFHIKSLISTQSNLSAKN